MFNTTLVGPGRVFVQSMSEAKFKSALRVAAGGGGERRQGGGHGAPPAVEMAER